MYFVGLAITPAFSFFVFGVSFSFGFSVKKKKKIGVQRVYSGEAHGEPGPAVRRLPCPNLCRSKRLSAQNGGADKYRAITATVFKLRFTQKIYEMLNSNGMSPKTRDEITIKIIIIIKKSDLCLYL